MPGPETSAEPAPAEGPPEISVVTTVLNERKGIRDLLDSLVLQQPAHEIVIVDAYSDDGTWEILQGYADRFPSIHPYRFKGKRGAGRNLGVRKASAPRVAFIDGDCIANAFWLQGLMKGFADGADIVAGRTLYMGYWAFTNMHRVELPHKGHDTTWPSCNLAYDRALFTRIGGFDERFVTAEDIDLNFRAIDTGAHLAYRRDAVVYAQARDSVKGFYKQAYYNGYGRKQLTLKHGRLWGEYRFGDMVRQHASVWGSVRLAAAVMGYLKCKRSEHAQEYRDAAGLPSTTNPALTGDADDQVEPMADQARGLPT